MPIIKSKGRKDTKFSQLINYVFQHDTDEEYTFTYVHNIEGAHATNKEEIIEAFKQNNVFRKQRKNGVGMLHEIISFHEDDTTYLQKYPEIIEDIARVYLELRAPNAIAIAKPHLDKNHLHLHLVISPNEKGNAKSIRMSKAEFRALRRTIERYQQEQYPALTKSYVHERDKAYYQKQHKEKQQTYISKATEKHGGIQTKKQALTIKLLDGMEASHDISSLKQWLDNQNITWYQRGGILQGVIVNNRKYRFSTLLKERQQEANRWKQWQGRETLSKTKTKDPKNNKPEQAKRFSKKEMDR